MVRLLCSVLLVVTCGCAYNGYGLTASHADAYVSAVSFYEGLDRSPYCSGVIVRTGLGPMVVTAGHCMINRSLFVRFRTGNGGDCVGMKRRASLTPDVAIVAPMCKTVIMMNEMAGVAPSVGSRVMAIGSPADEDFTVSYGSIAKRVQPDENGATLRVAIPAFYGSSGGGLFDEDGRLVGTVSKLLVGSPFVLAVPVETIRLVVNELELSHEAKGTRP